MVGQAMGNRRSAVVGERSVMGGGRRRMGEG